MKVKFVFDVDKITRDDIKWWVSHKSDISAKIKLCGKQFGDTRTTKLPKVVVDTIKIENTEFETIYES